jgi:outer membrane protein TolC
MIGLAALAAALLVTGCASPFDDDQYRTWQDRDPDQWRLTSDGSTHSRGTLRTRLADTGAEAPADTMDPAADGGLDQYVRLALERNPLIRAAERRVQRLGARVPQVTSLDDPMFQVAPFGDMAETAAGQVGLMTGVSQRLPFPGKLETRGRIAEQEVVMALSDLQQTRLRVVAELRRAYWSYYFATRALETTRRSRKLLDQFRQIAEAEYKAGNRSQPDVLRASTELSSVDSELITLAQRQATARGMLNQLMDRPVDAALAAPVVVKLRVIDAQLQPLLARASRHNPAIARAHQRIEQHRRKRELARLNRWPDLTVSANYNVIEDEGLAPSANGDDQWWFGFGVNLPVWGEKYQAAEREALLGMLEGVADLTAEQNRVAFEIQEAYLKVEAQQKLIKLFRDTVIPQARQTVKASQSGYRAGSVDFLTLMDNWRKLLNFELIEHRALAEMEQAVADLERAVGTAIDRSRTAPDPDSQDQETVQ